MKRFWRVTLISIVALVIISGAFATGVYTGASGRPEIARVASILGAAEASAPEVDMTAFWKTWNIIDEKFVPVGSASSTLASNQERVWGAIEGLVDSLGDQYSFFLPPEDKKIFEENLSGNFGGVGIEIDIRDEVLTVVAPLKGTPAERAGIKSGDKVIKIGDTLTVGLKIDEAVNLIRGEIGTSVTLAVLRDESAEPLEFELIRANIEVPVIDTEARDGVFIITLHSFSANSPRAFQQALRQFVSERKTNKLILDLRGNPGGYLEAAVDMASWFLPVGKVVVIEDRGGNSEQKAYRSRGYNAFTDNLKLAILVDEGSASASEILAGALSEYGKATLVGEKTFGKGSVQEVVAVTDDTSVKITIARWLTPNGKSISPDGLEPEVKVVAPTAEERKKNPDADPQLVKAIEILKK